MADFPYDSSRASLRDIVNGYHDIVAQQLLMLDMNGQTVLDQDRLEFVLHIRTNWRPTLLTNEVADELWLNYIRKDENITDFVMELSSQLHFYSCDEISLLEEACRKYADSIYTPTAATKDFDVDLIDSLYDPQTDDDPLNRHRWLMAVILLRLCNLGYIIQSVSQGTGVDVKSEAAKK